MTDFSKRSAEQEWMDDLSVEKGVLEKVLTDIDRVNRFLGGSTITIEGVSNLITDDYKKSYTILDVGCGNGFLLRKLVQWARQRHIELRCIGIDLNVKSLELAKVLSADFPEITYQEQDVLALKPSELECDILLCTLTMHHFLNRDIPIFLKQFTTLAQIGIVINDLQRSALAYHLFKVFSAIFIRSKIAKHDGLVSIQRGFLKEELQDFTHELPMMEHDIRWRWAFRYVWVMRHKRLRTHYE
ncbi:methyltransferase domain-containing protein [Pareuzebyella sediminis]|uniref:methyltransferase domain-containing protein n=1 Tax=Pareuzebyella sediminis TaxID=2607998 RepID=UPI0011EDBB41|nr:methyltransferase domain-containing protein [Pareuzebyella sediminis]